MQLKKYVWQPERGCERIMMDDKLNKLYTDFIGSNLLNGFQADNLDLLKQNAFITPENMNYIRDMIQVGYITGQLSSSGPMPGTGVLAVTANLFDTNSTATVYQPAIGEVYRLQTISLDPSGSATKRVIISITDGVNSAEIFDTGSFTTEAEDIKFQGPIFLDNNIYLKVTVNPNIAPGSGNGTVTKAVLIRER